MMSLNEKVEQKADQSSVGLHFLVWLGILVTPLIQKFEIMKKRPANRENPSRVLLVCVYDTVVLNITNETVYARFSPFGNILKILIFQRGEVTKFFIEFADVPSAQQAKLNLDGAKLFQTICKMNIYYSNFSKVDLKHETTEGVSLEQTMPSFPTDPFYFPTNYYSSYQIESYPIDPYSAYFKPFIENQPSPFCTVEQEDWSNSTPVPHQNFNLSSPKGKTREIELNIQNDIDWLLRSSEKKENLSQKKTNNSSFSNTSQNYLYLTFSIYSNITNRQLYNLFSNFGNVSVIKQTREKAFIKFRNYQFAAIAKNYLSGYTLQGNTLDLAYVDDIQPALPRQDEYAQVTFFDPSFDRFTNAKSISINPPGTTLHVSSIRREACRSDILKEIFSEFGEVIGVQVLSNGPQKNMALVQFEYIEDSFLAISEMHGSMLSGRKLQISFTKSRIF